MKKMTLKTILTLAALALLLTFTVSGTLAYISTKTENVENVFTPVKVDTEIVEEISGNAKTSIKIENVDAKENIPVYARAYLTGNWYNDAGQIVLPWDGQFTYNDTNWTKGNDGYYYYNEVLEVGALTKNLLKEGTSISATSDKAKYKGLHLEITVVHQSIQSTPTTAVSSAWGFVPGSN